MTWARKKKTKAGKRKVPAQKNQRVQEALQVTWVLKGQLKSIQLSYLRAGKLLAYVRDNKLYDALHHKDIESYAEERLRLRRASLYRYLQIYEWAKTDFYPIYVQKFIQCLGIYPIGSVVRLDTAEIGVVCRQNHDSPLRPWVRLVRGPAGESLPRGQELDLRERDPGGEKAFARSVTSTLEAGSAGFEIDAILSSEGATVAA